MIWKKCMYVFNSFFKPSIYWDVLTKYNWFYWFANLFMLSIRTDAALVAFSKEWNGQCVVINHTPFHTSFSRSRRVHRVQTIFMANGVSLDRPTKVTVSKLLLPSLIPIKVMLRHGLWGACAALWSHVLPAGYIKREVVKCFVSWLR